MLAALQHSNRNADDQAFQTKPCVYPTMIQPYLVDVVKISVDNV
ncbi:MAG: hypothetical protein ABGX13_02645 [Methylophilaceae bacterium]